MFSVCCNGTTLNFVFYPCCQCFCCSQVDRCYHFSRSMLLNRKKRTNYVCSAKLSKRLPLWSNSRHCAECPPLSHFRHTLFDTSTNFGLIDDDAAAYFDFWSEVHEPLGNYGALQQSLHDMNGAFNDSCSISRATNAFGLAG